MGLYQPNKMMQNQIKIKKYYQNIAQIIKLGYRQAKEFFKKVMEFFQNTFLTKLQVLLIHKTKYLVVFHHIILFLFIYN